MVNVVAVPIQAQETEQVSTYAIVSENYVSDWTKYYVYEYPYIEGLSSGKVDVCFRIKATYRYNELTGKVYGSPGTLTIEAMSKPVNCDFTIDFIDCKPIVTDDGYAFEYPNIKFDMTMSYENKPSVTHTNIGVLGTMYVPG